jgi:hypothetical protein
MMGKAVRKELWMDAKAWVKQWQETGRRLEVIRLQELRSTDTAAAILAFAGLDTRAAELYPPPPTSGLVEMQRLFRRLRAK